MFFDDFEERDLLKRIAAGEVNALDQIYQIYSPVVFTYLLQFLQNQEVAEDILQDVFLVLWKSAGRFRGDSSIKTWLLKIAHNRGVDWLRKHKKWVSLDDLQQEETQEMPDFRLDHQTADQIQKALQKLPPIQRAIIELAFYNQLSYKEISDILLCPLGTIKSRMNTALKRLYILLTND